MTCGPLVYTINDDPTPIEYDDALNQDPFIPLTGTYLLPDGVTSYLAPDGFAYLTP